MKNRIRFVRAGQWLILLLVFSATCYAQFNGTISGTVQDPSGSVVAGAAILLKNLATQNIQSTTSGPDGLFNFVSLGPADYEADVQAKGFAHYRLQITLQTNQTLNLPIKLVLASATQSIEVTGQAPVLDTADTRLQETFSTKTLSSLPLAGRNMVSLVTLAPGVTGLGVTSNGSPGSGRDNFSTETQVDASANGQGAVGNMYVIDGLDVTSSIRPGVLNMTPNPDTIQETSIQSNTYNVDYGRASSIQMMMTTKSGSSQYHGNISDYFTNQAFLAGTEFTHKYTPFHTNNISATIGGPIIPHHSGFFFFGIEPLRSSASVAYPVTFEDPAFTQFAQQNFPNTIGTKILSDYPVSKVSNVTVSSVASSLYPGCGTSAAANIPCNLPVLDIGNYSDTGYRNGDQYFLRLDKVFHSDRLYGSWYRTTLNSNGPTSRASFNTTNSFYQYALQVNETHIFSPNTLNEAAFAAMRVEGIQPKTGLFTVPVVNVTGLGAGFGDGFAEGDFIQHNYHWRDVLTHVAGAHTIKAGFEGLFGDDVEKFAGPYDLPNFAFNSMLDLVQDKVYTETSLAYDPLSGQKVQWDWNAAGVTFGAFAEDTWKVRQNVTLNYGLRWDDFGNPYSRSDNTAFSNFFLGPGQTYQEQIANGIVVRHHHALNRSITDVFSPRVGLAWDVTGKGDWLIKGGFGFFHNWPTLANLQEEFRGNPPGPIFPTFYGGSDPEPIFGLGTSNTQPFGYTVPTLPGGQLDAHGGLAGLQFGIGGINPNLVSPVSYVYSTSLERALGSKMMASVSYAGSVGRKLLSGGGQVYNVSYGQDINTMPGDLIIHNSTVPTRLNTSFGSISYTTNDRESAYNALILAWQGRFSRAFFNVSYTHSVSKDDTQVYPSYINVHQWYGPSIWDVPNRVSLAWNYLLPNPMRTNNFFSRVTGGWQVSGTTILQSGTPFVVYTNASFSNGGDYNADGDNYDFPNVTSYQYGTSRKSYLNGMFVPGNFTAPTPGTEGNERYNAFRGPGFAQSDLALLKNTAIKGPVNFQLRFEFYNVFNRANLNSVDANLPDGTFGRATGQYTPRLLQIGGNLSF